MLYVLFVVTVALTAHVQTARAPSYIEKQLMCALDQGPCDALGNQIKEALPEVLGRGCRACSPQQAATARHAIRIVQQQYPHHWRMLQSKYGSRNVQHFAGVPVKYGAYGGQYGGYQLNL